MKSTAAGFSLIEVLVAMALLATLAAFLLSIVSAAADVFEHAESRADRQREARAALHYIHREVASSPSHAGIRPWIEPTGTTSSRRLAFLTLLPPSQRTESGHPDTALVGFSINEDLELVRHVLTLTPEEPAVIDPDRLQRLWAEPGELLARNIAGLEASADVGKGVLELTVLALPEGAARRLRQAPGLSGNDFLRRFGQVTHLRIPLPET